MKGRLAIIGIFAAVSVFSVSTINAAENVKMPNPQLNNAAENVKMPNPQLKQVLPRTPEVKQHLDYTPLRCPAQITVNEIYTTTANTPGFKGGQTGSVPAVFKYKNAGKRSDTSCYCEYKNGDVLAYIYADLTGFKKCNTGLIPSSDGNSRSFGLMLYK